MINKNSSLTVGFIGIGLIGGSIAKRLHEQFPNMTLVAYNRSTPSLDLAMADGTITKGVTVIDETFSECDYIFLCTPVQHNAEYLAKLKPLVKPDCLITDVGSVKGNIHRIVEQLHMEKSFIGGHPMAGSEKTGYQNSSPYLLENAFYVLTKTEHTRLDALDDLTLLVKAMGAIPIVLEYQQHDYIVAAISHLPHLIASSLVNLVKDLDDSQEHMKKIAAGGFKDITRIASSSPEMWQEICATNAENIIELLENYIHSLQNIRDNLKADTSHYIFDLFTKSRDYRNSFSSGDSGLIQKNYSLCCDIIDETGAISSVALLLANHQISIQNIGIVHNREFEHGVLKIMFHNDSDTSKAGTVLAQHGYTVYYT